MHQQRTAFENFEQKGVIVRNEQILLFPQCFLLNQIIISPFVHIFDIKSLFAAKLEESKISISGKGLTNYDTMSHFDARKIYSCGKDCEKRRNYLLQEFYPFSTLYDLFFI